MGINIMLVDDDKLITSSLEMIINMDPEMDVVSVCSNGDEAYQEVLTRNDIDVILMDIRMPVCDGVLATKKILRDKPGSKIIILTTFDDDEYIFEALKFGAKGYLLKNVSPDKIVNAIKVVQQGNLLVHADVAAKLSGMLSQTTYDFLKEYDLSDREVEIIELIADGLTNKEIADKIYLTEGTIKNKVSDILHKLELRDRTQIAIFYLRKGRI